MFKLTSFLRTFQLQVHSHFPKFDHNVSVIRHMCVSAFCLQLVGKLYPRSLKMPPPPPPPPTHTHTHIPKKKKLGWGICGNDCYIKGRGHSVSVLSRFPLLLGSHLVTALHKRWMQSASKKGQTNKLERPTLQIKTPKRLNNF